MDNRALMSTGELAERWGCSTSWLANQRCAGVGPAFIKLGSKKVTYSLADVLAYEEAHRVGGEAA